MHDRLVHEGDVLSNSTRRAIQHSISPYLSLARKPWSISGNCLACWRLHGQETRKSEERGVTADLFRMSREDLSRWYRCWRRSGRGHQWRAHNLFFHFASWCSPLPPVPVPIFVLDLRHIPVHVHVHVSVVGRRRRRRLGPFGFDPGGRVGEVGACEAVFALALLGVVGARGGNLAEAFVLADALEAFELLGDGVDAGEGRRLGDLVWPEERLIHGDVWTVFGLSFSP
jgi:hypothetical protein